MIIVSRFKDYYDGGAAYGVDTGRRYIRETQEIEFRHKYNFDIIGFCGKLYPFDNIMSIIYNNPKKYTNYDPFLQFKEYKDRNNDTQYKLIPTAKHSYTNWWDKYHLRTNKQGHWEKAKLDKEYLQIFIEYQVPIFWIGRPNSLEGTKLVLNPCLKNLAFFKVMDTTQAFQEIEMYLSNVLVHDTQVIVPVGDDNVIRDSKGFDKWTFRKEKEK